MLFYCEPVRGTCNSCGLLRVLDTLLLMGVLTPLLKEDKTFIWLLSKLINYFLKNNNCHSYNRLECSPV